MYLNGPKNVRCGVHGIEETTAGLFSGQGNVPCECVHWESVRG